MYNNNFTIYPSIDDQYSYYEETAIGLKEENKTMTILQSD